MMKSKLKYLYRVVYKDKTLYDQNINDVSTQLSSKSCFYDLKLKDIHFFTLSDGIHSYTLDLSDGGFSINGSPKLYLTTLQLHEFELIHYRKVTTQLTDDQETTINFVLGYSAKSEDGTLVNNQIIII